MAEDSDSSERETTYGKGSSRSDTTAASTGQSEYDDRDRGVDTDGAAASLPDFEDFEPEDASGEDGGDEGGPELEQGAEVSFVLDGDEFEGEVVEVDGDDATIDAHGVEVPVSEAENVSPIEPSEADETNSLDDVEVETVNLSDFESESSGDASADADDENDLPDEFYEDDLTPDAPESANLDRAVEYRGVEEEAGESGAFEQSMAVGITEDGDRMFATIEDDRILGNNAAVARFREAGGDALDDAIPEMHVDREREAAVMADAGPEDSKSVSGWAYDNEDKMDDVDWDEDSYRRAIGAKVALGDLDIGGNVVTGSSGEFTAIDFDLAGSSLESQDERIAEKTSGYGSEHDGVWDKAEERINRQTRHLPFDMDGDDIREAASEVVESVDKDQLEEALDDDPLVNDRTRDAVIANIELLRGETDT